MRAIIDGVLYDTDDMRKLASDSADCSPRDFQWWAETLYMAGPSVFALHGRGGPMSRWAETVGINEWSGGEQLVGLTDGQAREWAEDHCDAETYLSIAAVAGWGVPKAGDIPSEVTVRTTVKPRGNSLGFNLTKELAQLGLDVGDEVEVTIRRV